MSRRNNTNITHPKYLIIHKEKLESPQNLKTLGQLTQDCDTGEEPSRFVVVQSSRGN